MPGSGGKAKSSPDFGIAKLLDPQEGSDAWLLTREGHSALTPAYAAPEQLTGGHVTTATDVYALGVLVYELLCGRHPTGVATSSAAELIRAIVETEPMRPSEVATRPRSDDSVTVEVAAARRATTPQRLHSQLRGDLDNIVARALAKRPEDRYPSVEALAEDLRRYTSHRPVSARSPGPGYRLGRRTFDRIGCASCHVPDLVIERDRRVADVETRYDPASGGLNGLFATAAGFFDEVDDGSGYPTLKRARGGRFVVCGIYADFKRHDLGPSFHERNFVTTEVNYEESVQREFMTEPLWGVGSTAPYGRDGRSINLREVILRHGGEALQAGQRFEALSPVLQDAVVDFLESLVLFPPDDTASNLNPGDPLQTGYPQLGHGSSIFLGALFNDPGDPE